MTNTDKQKQAIAENNKRVLEKLRAGHNLSTSTTQDTWFPPRGKFDKAKGRMVVAAPDKEPQ